MRWFRKKIVQSKLDLSLFEAECEVTNSICTNLTNLSQQDIRKIGETIQSTSDNNPFVKKHGLLFEYRVLHKNKPYAIWYMEDFYGVQFTINSVCENGDFLALAKSHCHRGYNQSVFKENGIWMESGFEELNEEIIEILSSLPSRLKRYPVNLDFFRKKRKMEHTEYDKINH